MLHDKMTCPHCDAVFVPVECPRCKTVLSLEDTLLDTKVECPRRPICDCVFVPRDAIYQAHRKRLADMGRVFKWVLRISMGSLAIFFAWLKFQDVDFVSMGKQVDVDVLLRLAIALYYFSWCAGAPWEVSDMESFFSVPPNRGRIPVAVFSWIALLVGIAAVLCLVHSFTVFALMLTGFWGANIVGWYYRGTVVDPTVRASEDYYEKRNKYDKLESLYVFSKLNGGKWHWWRFGAGAVLLICVNLLAFTPLARIIGDAGGGVPEDVVQALSVLCFVLAVEGWIWFERIQARRCYQLISYLGKKYDFSLKAATSLPPATGEPMIARSAQSASAACNTAADRQAQQQAHANPPPDDRRKMELEFAKLQLEVEPVRLQRDSAMAPPQLEQTQAETTNARQQFELPTQELPAELKYVSPRREVTAMPATVALNESTSVKSKSNGVCALGAAERDAIESHAHDAQERAALPEADAQKTDGDAKVGEAEAVVKHAEIEPASGIAPDTKQIKEPAEAKQ